MNKLALWIGILLVSAGSFNMARADRIPEGRAVSSADPAFEKIADEAATETDRQLAQEIERLKTQESALDKFVAHNKKLIAAQNALRDELGRFRRPETFLEQLSADTRREFGRSWNAGWIINLVGSDSRLSAGTTVLAWKFLAVNPAITYIPDAADRRGELEVQFPIRLERIPIGGGRELGNLVRSERGTGGWYDHCVMRLVPSHNLSSGRFGFGVRVGLEF